MRPIDKGPCPQVNGQDKTVSNYKEWRKDLIDRIGSYCVYCNMPITHNLQVEHVVPKNPKPGEEQGGLLDWDNMLLACGSCNNAKSNQPSTDRLHYLPEYHNTFIPFIAKRVKEIHDALIIDVNPQLLPTQKEKAKKTIELFKFDSVDLRGGIVDLRWLKRDEEAKKIEAIRGLLEMAKNSPDYDEDLVGKYVAMQANGGFFFLWFKKFENEPCVIKWLIHPDCFHGVAQNCFDKNNGYKLMPRNLLNIEDPI